MSKSIGNVVYCLSFIEDDENEDNYFLFVEGLIDNFVFSMQQIGMIFFVFLYHYSMYLSCRFWFLFKDQTNIKDVILVYRPF